MPNNTNQQGVYVSDPDNHDDKTLYARGNLGQRYIYHIPLRSTPGVGPVAVTGGSRSMQIVKMDSTLTTPPTRGAVIWWRDKAAYEVTTNQTNAINRNEVAGVMPGGCTPGNYTSIQYRGPQYTQVTAADAAAFVTGDSLIPSAADQGRASRVALGTAPTHTKIGTATGPVVGGNLVLTDLCIPETT